MIFTANTVNIIYYYDKSLDIFTIIIYFTAMIVKYDLHKMILFHRKQAKLSRNELAELAGVGKTVIYDLEKGKQTVKWSTIISILDALNIDIKFQSPLMEEYEKSISQNS